MSTAGPLADKTVTAFGDSITPMVADSVSCRWRAIDSTTYA
jgi:hypothetical protein